MLARLLAASVCAGVCLAAPLAAQQPSPPWRVARHFPISRYGDPILVPVTVGGKEYLFVLDTGATTTVFDRSLRPLLGKPLATREVTTPGKNIVVELFSWPSATVAGFSYQSRIPVMCVDLEGARQVCGQPIHGLVGMDFLRNYVVQANFDGQRITLSQSGVGDPATWGERQPMLFDRAGNPKLRASVSGVSESFLLDTGASGCNLSAGIFDAIVDRGEAQIVGEALNFTAGGDVKTSIARLRSFTVGGFEQRGLLFSSNPRRSSVGLSFLSRYAVTLDFPNRAIYLRKGERFNEPDHPDLSGLHLLRRDGARSLIWSTPLAPPHRLASSRATCWWRWTASRSKRSISTRCAGVCVPARAATCV